MTQFVLYKLYSMNTYECIVLPVFRLYFKDDEFNLGDRFPVFANVYHVEVTELSSQSFLKCSCLLYERCGLPCTHIIKITDEIEETMIKVQHRKIFQVNFGIRESDLSKELMKACSLQILHEGMGMPISETCIEKARNPSTLRLNLDDMDIFDVVDNLEYPKIYYGTTQYDLSQANFVLANNNCVTMEEMEHNFPSEGHSSTDSIG